MRFLFLALWFALPIYAMGLGTPSSLARLSKVSGGGGSPPAAPTDLVVTLVDASGVTLGWTDNSMNEDGFWVEADNGTGWLAWTFFNGSGDNPTLPSANSYFAATADSPEGSQASLSFLKFRIFATNAFGSSAYSSEVQVPPSVPVTDLDAVWDEITTFVLTFTATGENYTQVEVQVNINGGGWIPDGNYPDDGGGSIPVTDSDAAAAMVLMQPVLFRLRYVNSGGNGPWSNESEAHP